MALIENKISIDEKSTKKILDWINQVLSKFLNQPKWLIFLVATSIIFSCCYFWYTHKQDTKKVEELQEQVLNISKDVDSNIGVEELIYIITEIKILENVLEENYNERIYELDATINCLEKYHPDDPSIADLKSIKKRMEINKESYNQHYKLIMNKLDNFVDENDSINAKLQK